MKTSDLTLNSGIIYGYVVAILDDVWPVRGILCLNFTAHATLS